ncbi:hypothetical protein [Sphingobium sp.]|uniref:hypothetical protein n=1 Tax=Sphingobium sp. TaxID=1912891 RepID=UPI002D7FB34B|nr:hypothetical protein [Sphingobium sp.]
MNDGTAKQQASSKDRTSRWIDAMRAQDYDTVWAISQEALSERKPEQRDDPTLPYHYRWVWDGRDYHRKHCLVRCYHGLGDTIQFARFLPLLGARAASLKVEVQPRLLPLLNAVFQKVGHQGIELVPFDPVRPAPPSECDMEITELDFALRARPADAPMPYISVSRALLPRSVVGLCYEAGDWDPARCIPADLLQPLCSLAPCLTLVPEPTSLDVLNPGGCPFDMEITAALVAAMDLVITTDTMIAHLAGAMGKPTWLLLKAEPDWRWPVGSRHTPWYPSIRIYSQTVSGDWRGVLAEVWHDLAAVALSAKEL